MAEPIRVLSVDDHPLMREGIAAMIRNESDLRLVAEVANGREAIEGFRAHRPDVTLMDLRLPDMSGIDAMIAIRTEFPDARIIMLTTFDGDVDIQRSRAAGARGYLLKSMPPGELVDGIRHVHRGLKRIPPEIAAHLAEHLSDDALTAREVGAGQRRARQSKSRRRGATLHHRGDGEGAREAHHGKARCARSNGGGDDRHPAGHHPAVGVQYLHQGIRAARDGRSVSACRDSFPLFLTERPAWGCCSCESRSASRSRFQGLAYLRADDGPWSVTIMGLLMIATGALLIAGLLTPVACILTQLISIAVAFPVLPSTMFDLPDGRPTTLFLFVMAVAILLLGPGAFSMDARWFGRREVVIPR